MKKFLILLGLGLVVGFGPGRFNALANLEVTAEVQVRAKSDFYVPLETHGSWVEVGSYGRCWRPAGVTLDWRPYCDGHWIWTDCGWYWDSDDPWAWACYHYGYWVFDSAHGWIWVPDVEWGPAWVSWRVGGGYIGWAPLPPPGLFWGRVGAPSAFVFVTEGRFTEPLRRTSVVINQTKIIDATKSINNITHETRTVAGTSRALVVNHGPGIEPIEKATGRKVGAVRIQDVARPGPRPAAMRPQKSALPRQGPNLRPKRLLVTGHRSLAERLPRRAHSHRPLRQGLWRRGMEQPALHRDPGLTRGTGKGMGMTAPEVQNGSVSFAARVGDTTVVDQNPPLRSRFERGHFAFLGNFPPRKCGIATFTADLLSAIATELPECQCLAVPINDIRAAYRYPDAVRFEIDEQDLSSYQRAADFLNIRNVDVLSLQHEFGIFGGPAGRHVLALLGELKLPVVTTLHTILREPNPDQRRVMQGLIARSARLVVMSERGREILQEVYRAPAGKVDLIPHGIPDMPFVDPNYYKDQFGVEGKTVLLTFGLLSPSKGIEYVIQALPEIVAEFPNVAYIVLGATHPSELREQGEAWRLSLERLAKKHKVQKHVIFYNRYVELEELKAFIGAADIYLTPYLNEAQVTSGTLAYTFGAGKAVISTPYWHAAELLADGRGVLVPFRDPAALAREVTGLLRDETRRHAIRKNAYRLGREMIWSNVARQYLRSFEAARLDGAVLSRKIFATKPLDEQPRQLPSFKFDHLSRMTDSTGMFQHALFKVPNFSHGYCTDDNARAFILAVLLDELEEEPERTRDLATTTAAFLHHAFEPKTTRFHNHLSFDRRWLDETGSEDCHGRALWALGTGVGRSLHRSFQIMAGQLFERALPAALEFSAPRPWAFSLLGIHEYLHRLNGERAPTEIREALTVRLMELFDRNAQPEWPWFQDILTYDNAKLPHALILSGRATGQEHVFERGLETLRWLVSIQQSESGDFRPIGANGFYPRGQQRSNFDQQPIEAHATTSACLEAYRATGDVWWYDQAQRAFDWFLGWNDLGLELYSSNTGGCCDALHVDRVNQNQGAESTLAFLLSLAELRLVQNAVAVFNSPAA